jgi:hypothetical protein
MTALVQLWGITPALPRRRICANNSPPGAEAGCISLEFCEAAGTEAGCISLEFHEAAGMEAGCIDFVGFCFAKT